MASGLPVSGFKDALLISGGKLPHPKNSSCYVWLCVAFMPDRGRNEGSSWFRVSVRIQSLLFTFERDCSVDTGISPILPPWGGWCRWHFLVPKTILGSLKPIEIQSVFIKPTTFVLRAAPKLSQDVFPNTSRARVSSGTHGLHTVLCITAIRSQHRHNGEQLLGWTKHCITGETLDRTLRAAVPSPSPSQPFTTSVPFRLHHPAAQTSLFALDGARANPTPGQHLQSPSISVQCLVIFVSSACTKQINFCLFFHPR